MRINILIAPHSVTKATWEKGLEECLASLYSSLASKHSVWAEADVLAVHEVTSSMAKLWILACRARLLVIVVCMVRKCKELDG